MSAISQQLRGLAREMTGRCRAVALPMSSVGDCAKSLAKLSIDTDADRVGWMLKEAERSAELVERVEGSLATAGAMLADMSNRIGLLSTNISARLAQQKALSQCIANVEVSLRSAGFDQSRGSALHRGVLDRLRRRYTMVEERKVHDRYAGSQKDHTCSASPAGEEFDLAVVLF